jgi:hypothetical protein
MVTSSRSAITLFDLHRRVRETCTSAQENAWGPLAGRSVLRMARHDLAFADERFTCGS